MITNEELLRASISRLLEEVNYCTLTDPEGIEAEYVLIEADVWKELLRRLPDPEHS